MSETCIRCGRQYAYCWDTDTELWLSVVGKKEGHLCIPCFSEQATEKTGKRMLWLGGVEHLDPSKHTIREQLPDGAGEKGRTQ